MELYKEPSSILMKFHKNEKSEMSEFQLSYLCGLMKEKVPNKVLEVGVAAGTTSAVILNCLSQVNSNATMYSVDLSEQYYKDGSKRTGYMIEQAKQEIANVCTHKLFLGKYLPEFLNEIGKGIDFVIIDTVHVLPGEILDFLAVFPYLTEDAVIVLHDVILHHENIKCVKEAYATKILLDTVVGEKIFLEDSSSYAGYPNIGAFRINKDTEKYIWDVFSSLTINWAYMPEKRELDIYRKWYEQFYDKKYIELFDRAVMLNQDSAERRKVKSQKEEEQKRKRIREFYEALNQTGKKVFIYGASTCAERMENYIQMLGFKIDGFLVSDSEPLEKKVQKNVYHISEIPCEKENSVVLLGLDQKYHDIIRKNLTGFSTVFPVESDGYESFCKYIFEAI